MEGAERIHGGISDNRKCYARRINIIPYLYIYMNVKNWTFSQRLRHRCHLFVTNESEVPRPTIFALTCHNFCAISASCVAFGGVATWQSLKQVTNMCLLLWNVCTLLSNLHWKVNYWRNPHDKTQALALVCILNLLTVCI